MALEGQSNPSQIRREARVRFQRHLVTLDEIAADPEAKHSARIDAIRALGDFGMGRADQAAVHVHAEGGAMLGIVMLPALGSAEAPELAAKRLLPPPSDPSDD
jgi:hypothetical protein